MSERWIEREDGRMLCALSNDDSGLLMYLKDSDDTGLTSRNPNFDGDPKAIIEFTLENGQVDEYPASWAIGLDLIERALQDFNNNGFLPEYITWAE